MMLSVGETVDVFYDESNPADARLASVWDLYFWPILFGGIATLLFGLGAGALMRAPR
jgi:hypothetical protein